MGMYGTGFSYANTQRVRIMNTANLGTHSQKMYDKKTELSLAPVAKPKLLDQLRDALRSRHYSHRTEQTYCSWVTNVYRPTFTAAARQ